MSKWAHRRWPGGCWIDRLTGQLRAGVMEHDRVDGGVVVVWIALDGTRRWSRIRRAGRNPVAGVGIPQQTR